MCVGVETLAALPRTAAEIADTPVVYGPSEGSAVKASFKFCKDWMNVVGDGICRSAAASGAARWKSRLIEGGSVSSVALICMS